MWARLPECVSALPSWMVLILSCCLPFAALQQCAWPLLLQIAAHIAAPLPAGGVGRALADDWWKATTALQQMAAAPGEDRILSVVLGAPHALQIWRWAAILQSLTAGSISRCLTHVPSPARRALLSSCEAPQQRPLLLLGMWLCLPLCRLLCPELLCTFRVAGATQGLVDLAGQCAALAPPAPPTALLPDD